MFDRLVGERDGSWLVAALRRRWWVILLVAVVAGAGANVLSGRQTKKYSASAGLLFTDNTLQQELISKNINISVDPTRQAATEQALLQLPTVGRLVARQLNIPASRVLGEVTFSSDAQSDAVTVTATDPVPVVAKNIANDYVNAYIAFRKQSAEQQLTQAETLINNKLALIPASEQGGAVAQALIGDRNTLDLLKASQTGDAQVVQNAVTPDSPSFPNPAKDTVLGLILGLLVGGTLVVLLERRDRRIKTPAEVEAVYGVPVIGTIPESSNLRVGRAPTAREQDAFLMIRSQLRYFDVDRHIRRVMVTSAESGEGKSVVSLNLARAAARTVEGRALLIEADLRRPSLHRLIGHGSAAGLAELLSHSQDLESGIRELVINVDDVDAATHGGHLDILLAGSTPPNPVELLESRRMVSLLESADDMYDMVIIDTAPIGVVSDAMPLTHQVDGLVVISRMGYSHRDHATRLMKRLNGLHAHVLGVVINSFRRNADASYGYYADYAAPDESTERRGRATSRQRSAR